MTSPPETLRLAELLSSAARVPVTVVAEHAAFRRTHQTLQGGKGIEADLVCDHSSVHGTTVLYFRFRSRQSGNLRVLIEGAREAGYGRGYLAPYPGGGCLWLPAVLVARRYDRHSRIVGETRGEITNGKTSGTLEIVARMTEGEVIDIPLLRGHGDAEGFAREVVSPHPIEHVRLNQDSWYDVGGIAQLWDYLVHGRVYDPRWESGGIRFECQQCAHTWYAHLSYLYRQTGKQLYGALRDSVAYSVLLSLPHDHRWRHGEWTDTMETHTRFQTDGIHLLLQHYESCGNEAFLDAACGAADYLIGIADALDDGGAWYLHDTLELEDNPKLSGFPLNRRSTAFGKRSSNTLCLNTHAWTLTALWRLTTICRGERRETYERAFARGMEALRAVLSVHSGEALYRSIYAMRDACLGWKIRFGAALPLKACDAVLRRALRRLKPKLPRLAMPNGYIERDLERSTLADRYVPVNLKDLALLSKLTGCEWLRPFVRRGLSHWIHSGLFRKELPRSPTAQQSLDAALLLATADATCSDLAREIYREMRLQRRSVTVDALAGIAGDDQWTLPRVIPEAMAEIFATAEGRIHADRRS